MPSQPLLPSYGSVSEQPPRYGRHDSRRNAVPSAGSLVEYLCLVIFTGTAFVASFWASQSVFPPETTQPEPVSSPLLPYFASLSLLISFCFWIGYIILIAKDDTGGPRLQRHLLVSASVVGKLILAAAHSVLYYAYLRSYPYSSHPDWILMFLAAQAWWDVFLVAVNCCLKATA